MQNAGKRRGIKRDPVEQTAQYLAIEVELEAKIDAKLAGLRRTRGYCFRYWQAKEEILARDYGIAWQSPRMLNPGVRFD